MKLNYLTIIVASMLLSVYSCGPSKNIPQNEVVQTIPCEGKQYETTKDHFRASAQGVSPYQQNAKDIAIQNAKQTLAERRDGITKAVDGRLAHMQHTKHGELIKLSDED